MSRCTYIDIQYIDTNECKYNIEVAQQLGIKSFLQKRRIKEDGEKLSAECEWVRANFWAAPMSREEMS